MKKRILALLLAVVMIAGMIPTIAAVNPMPARVIRPDTTHRATYTFYVGEEVRPEAVSAKFEDGILKISLPKVEEKKLPASTTIAIE